MTPRIPLRRRISEASPARCAISLLGAASLAAFVLVADGAEPPPTRSVAVKVVDRLGRPVADVSACLLPDCTKVTWRAEKEGYVAEVPAGDAPAALRLTARSFAPAEVPVKPHANAVGATLKAKGSVKLAFLAPEG
ncbi:MAG TPA: hypothetical protein PLL76_12930, partial [Thermoanaerobaculia bacterium]|nr:hypothetical protein [Thermoanaerobaculia bacterium]